MWWPSRWWRAAKTASRARSRARAACPPQPARKALGAAAGDLLGGEQQRVNIARGFITPHPVLLLDEPTASLDAKNREVVVELIADKKAAGVALLGIFHDADVREAVADRIIDVTEFAAGKIAA